MASALAVQYCRVVAPEKLPDRLITSGVFCQQESASLQQQVVLAYLFEVTKPWFSSSKLFTTLASTLQAEHAKLVPNQPLDDQFELLLRGVNQALNTISEEGETDWIGNLNGLILVINAEELHFAQTGRCPTYLLQNNRIRQITDDPQEAAEPHPLRTFANLASGHLIEGDQLLIANQELYGEISLDALRRIINTNTPYGSCQAISRELKREKNAAASCLIMKADSDAAPATEPTEIMLEEEMQGTMRKVGKRLAPLLHRAKELGQKAGSAGLEVAKQTGTTLKDNVAPKAAGLVKKGIERLKTDEKPLEEVGLDPAHQPVVEIIVSKTKREHEQMAAIASAAESRLEQDDDGFVSVIPDSERRIETVKPIQNPLLLFLTRTLPKIGVDFLVMASEWLKIPRNKKIASLAAGVVIIFITIGLVSHALHHSNGSTVVNQKNDTAITTTQALITKITTEIKNGNVTQAGQDIAIAENTINGLQTPSISQQNQATSLWQSVITQADILNKTTRFTTPVATYSIGAQSTQFITDLPYFYTWGPGNSIARTGQGDLSQVQATVPLPDSTDSIISLARTSETDTTGYVLTKADKVYTMFQNGTSTTLTPITPASGDFATGDQLDTYNGNLYILDGKTGLLWKYTNTGTTYAKGVSVIDINQYDIQGSISFAIDGSIYFLNSSGAVTRFTSGKQDVFQLSSQPYQAEHMIQPAQIITDPTYQYIYVLDAGVSSGIHSSAMVYTYTKDGVYVGSYAFPDSLTKITAFDVNPKTNKLWALNDGKIYEFNTQ